MFVILAGSAMGVHAKPIIAYSLKDWPDIWLTQIKKNEGYLIF
mgnify:CR=1 FL=1